MTCLTPTIILLRNNACFIEKVCCSQAFILKKSVAGCCGTGKEKNWRSMEKANVMELLHGHFHFKVLPHGRVDRKKATCSHCQVELSYHRSTSSLKYHQNAKHSVDTSKSFNETDSGARPRQTTLDAAYGRNTDKQR